MCRRRWYGPGPRVARAASGGSGVVPPGQDLRTLRCMLGMLTGGLLVAAFLAVAGAALAALLWLLRVSRPGRSEAHTGG